MCLSPSPRISFSFCVISQTIDKKIDVIPRCLQFLSEMNDLLADSENSALFRKIVSDIMHSVFQSMNEGTLALFPDPGKDEILKKRNKQTKTNKQTRGDPSAARYASDSVACSSLFSIFTFSCVSRNRLS